MAEKDKELTIDEFLEYVYQIEQKMKELKDKRNFDERFASMLLNSTDPEDQFKAEMIMKIMTVMDRFDFFINYIRHPVKMEGILQRKLDGTVQLDGTVINDHTPVEVMKDGRWYLGLLQKNPLTKQYEIKDVDGKTLIDKIEQIKARIR